MSCKITTIIPTHNRAELLQRALRSVLAQTRPADEIIVVDDGSTDHTPAMMARLFPQITYHVQLNKGVSAARNAGIRIARGDWIALLDSDDEWLPDKLERQEKALLENPEYSLCHGEEIWIRHGKRVNPMQKHRKFGGWIFEKCLPLCVISPSATLMRRSLFDRVGFFDETLPACEDYDLWLRICAHYPVLFLEEPLMNKYGGHPDQLSRRYWGMDRFRIRALEKVLRDPQLSPENRIATLETLIQKIEIYLEGAQKRGKIADIEDYRVKLHAFQALLKQEGG